MIGAIGHREAGGEAGGVDFHVGELGRAWVEHDGCGAVGHIEGDMAGVGAVGHVEEGAAPDEDAGLLRGDGLVSVISVERSRL